MRSWEIHIEGRVQGVGFRPHVYRLATAHNLFGEVSNGPRGVHICCNGDEANVMTFIQQLLDKPPTMAVITGHRIKPIAFREYLRFSISESQVEGEAGLLMAPDFCLCSDCRRELLDPLNRRFSYAFITCTNCGPRYAVQSGLPYDRERTSMAEFLMCPDCQSEYESPEDRRYHSQTNSCPSCGPQWKLLDQQLVDTKVEEIIQVADAMRAGKIIAVKGTSGYLLCCDATNDQAVGELRKRKARPDKPFALLVADLDTANSIADLSLQARKALSSPASPIVLAPKKSSTKIARSVAADSAYFGMMLPNQGMSTLLVEAFGRPMVATSANLSGEPILSEGQEGIVAQLADYVLTHNLPILQAQDDSLVRFCETSQRRIIIRRARGMAPSIHPTMATPSGPDILALGADIKASFGLRSNGQYVLSQRLGELGHLPAQVEFKKALKRLGQLCSVKPNVVLTDLHPGYFGRMMAQEMADEQNWPLYEVQHHEAHFAALIGEQNLMAETEDVLGVVWDGLGYGRDGHIWGGEFFRLVDNSFSRIDHLSYFPQLGGENMGLDPKYAALAWAGDLPKAQQLLVGSLGKSQLHTLLRLRERARIKTSSIGRLFDAVSALTGICTTQQYEGQAAIKLEAAARTAYKRYGLVEGYPSSCLKQDLINDIGRIPNELIALKFHQSLVDWMAEIAQNQGVRTIACTGGCFQNALLVDLIQQSLGGEFKLVFHEHLAPNDENIAYGQIIHYALTQEHALVENTQKTAVCA